MILVAFDLSSGFGRMALAAFLLSLLLKKVLDQLIHSLCLECNATVIVILLHKIKTMHIQPPYLHRILRSFLEVLPVRILRKDLLDSHALSFGVGIGVGVGFDCEIIDKIYLISWLTWVIGAFYGLGVVKFEYLLYEVYFLTALEELLLLLGQPKLIALVCLIFTVSHHCIRSKLHVQSLTIFPYDPFTFLKTSSSLLFTFSPTKTSDCGWG